MRPGLAFDPTRSFQVAWKLLKQAPVTVLVGGLLLWFFEGGGGGGFQYVFRDRGLSGLQVNDDSIQRVFREMRPLLLLLIPALLCVGVAFFALSSWLQVGYARAIESAVRCGKDELGKVFSGGDRFGAMLLARLLCGLIYVAALVPMLAVVVGAAFLARNDEFRLLSVIIPVGIALVWCLVLIYVGLGLYLVNAIVAFENLSPTDSIARSWKLASGNRLQLFWFCLF